jgi:hypothetical protein
MFAQRGKNLEFFYLCLIEVGIINFDQSPMHFCFLSFTLLKSLTHGTLEAFFIHTAMLPRGLFLMLARKGIWLPAE